LFSWFEGEEPKAYPQGLHKSAEVLKKRKRVSKEKGKLTLRLAFLLSSDRFFSEELKLNLSGEHQEF
jgi:hypothetical protein